MNVYQEEIIVICNKMNRRNSEADQSHSQYNYDQNRANYAPLENCANYQESQRVFKKISASNSRRSSYKNPEAVLSNYQTYFVPVTGTTKLKEQNIHAHYSYSSNSLSPPYVQSKNKVNDAGRNKIVYIKYPNDEPKNAKYYSQSNYLRKEQENLLEYGIVPPSQNYSYFIPDSKSIYENPPQKIPKMVYSSYVPEIDVKFANNSNLYYPYSSEPSISSQRSIDDAIDYSLNKSNYKDEPEKMSVNKSQAQELSMKFSNLLKRIPRSNASNKKTKNCVYQVEVDDIYGTPCDETPTKQHSTINANTQTSNHALNEKNSVNKVKLSNEYTQTEYENVCANRSKETQTLNYFGGHFFGGFINNLVKKGHYLYSFYLRTTVIRWLRRILIELAWSMYNCPANCPMQDRIIFSYLNHIESKSPLGAKESQIYSCPRPPSRRSCAKQRMKN